MPTFAIASPEEQAQLQKAAPTTVDLTAYTAALAALKAQPNPESPAYSVWAKITLDGQESRKTVLRRFAQAAKIAGVHVANRRHATDQRIVWLRLRPPPVPKATSANGPVTRPAPAASPSVRAARVPAAAAS